MDENADTTHDAASRYVCLDKIVVLIERRYEFTCLHDENKSINLIA